MLRYFWIGIVSVFLIGCQAISPPADTTVGWTWSYRAGDYIRSKPIVYEHAVYIGTDDNHVHAIGLYSGTPLWQYQTDDNVTAVTVDETGAYFGSWDGAIYALDTAGRLRWQYQTDGWVSAAPVVEQGVLYVGSHDGSVYALATTDGALLWQYRTNGAIEASAALVGELVVFGSTDGYLHALDAERGQRAWSFRTGNAIVAPPIFDGEHLYAGSLDGAFYSLDPADGQLRWHFTAKGGFASTPVVAGGVVYVAADDRQIYALDAEDGRLLWQQTTGELIRSSLAVWEDLLFAGSDSGNLYAFARNTGNRMWRYRVGGMITAGPTVAGNRLYVGSTANQLQAIVLAAEESRLVTATVATTSLQPNEIVVPRSLSGRQGGALAEQLPHIEEYARLWVAQAAMPSVDAIRALQDVIAFRPHSPAAYAAHVTLARYYALHSEPDAEESYRAALALDDDIALHLEFANYLESQGKPADAYAEYHLLLRRRVDAFAGMRRTGDPLTVAADFNAAAFYSDAFESLKEVDDPAAWPLRGEALLWLGRYEESLAAYQAAVAADPNDETARFGLALALAWLGRGEEALEEYSKVNTPASIQNQAQLLAAEESERALALYLESPNPSAWWSATALLESQGRLTETVPIYARMATTETQYADDAAYRLYVLGQRLDDAEIQAQGQRLLADLGLNWLALRSSNKDLQLPVSAPVDLEETRLVKVQALEALGYDDLAHHELTLAAHISERPEVDLTVAQALLARGQIVEAQAIAERYVRRHEVAPIAFWELSYPRPYSKTVMAAAAEFDVDPLLIWAVMREESRFDPDARSHANARGLMQVIPLTQAWIADELDLTLAPGDAYVPETSVRMGAWLLSFLVEYFDDDVELAILAYNAGAGSVESWQANPLVENRDDLLRWIGYGETRLFLKRVALGYEIYRTLYGTE